MYCTKCGNKVPDGAKFCTNCGTKIEPKVVESVVEPAPEAKLEPLVESIVQPVAEPVVEAAAEAKPEPTVEPVVEFKPEAQPEVTPGRAKVAQEKKGNGKIIAIVAAVVLAVVIGAALLLGGGGSEGDAPYAFADQLEQIENEDYSGLARYQIDMLDELKEEIIQFSEDGDLDSAQEYFDKFYACLEAFRNPGSANLQVKQVDVSEFPNVKVYFSLIDPATGEAFEGLDSELFYIMEMAGDENKFVSREILNAAQLNLAENLNISMVADVSGSMIGDPIDQAKSVMFDFINTVQFDVGDKVSLISFADTVEAKIPFTTNGKLVKDTIAGLQLQNMTAFYDALYVALNQIIGEEGAKCIIAFTDGVDNYSQCTPATVIDLASKYNIPIFIIGIGDSIDQNAQRIAVATGGEYTNISQASSMDQIYDDIYRAQKEMYVIEYVTGTEAPEDVERNLGLGYVGGGYSANMEYMYNPSVLLEGTKAADNIMTSEFIFPDSDVRYITAADLANLTEWELRIARNEIYARKGRMFQDQKLQDYFNSTSWYNGTIPANQFNESMLNEVEKANAYFIRSYENMNGFN